MDMAISLQQHCNPPTFFFFNRSKASDIPKFRLLPHHGVLLQGRRHPSTPAFAYQAEPDNVALHYKLRQVTVATVLGASICFSDPTLAFKGGGPYGAGVTRGVDLSGSDFSGQTLIKQDFKASILRQVNFKGAKLIGASFFDADLTGADLSDADLRGADFSLANAQKANFSNANLDGALVTGNTSFKGAKINGADFTDVLFRDDQRGYLCSVADGVNPVTGNATRDTLQC